jgi:hypothetical protein
MIRRAEYRLETARDAIDALLYLVAVKRKSRIWLATEEIALIYLVPRDLPLRDDPRRIVAIVGSQRMRL